MYDRVTTSGIDTNSVGVANMQRLTLFGNYPAMHETPGAEMASVEQAGQNQGSPHLWLAALIVGTAALWIVNQHVAFGPLNLAFIVMAVVAGIVLLKTIFGRFYVPGLSPVILAA